MVTPPVRLNLRAVCGTANIPLPRVLGGTISFFVGDLTVLLRVIFFPAPATRLPEVLGKPVP